MLIHNHFDHTTDDWEYMRTCARIRDISVTALCKRLINAIAREQLVLAVLDDEGEQQKVREKHEHRWREQWRQPSSQ